MDILVPISFFAMIAAIILVPKYLRSRERDQMHQTLRLAYEKGQPAPLELMESFQTGRVDPRPYAPVQDLSQRDLRLGVIWLAVGLGVLLIGGAFYAMLYSVGGAVETACSFAALAAIPLCVGLAFLLLYALGRRTRA